MPTETILGATRRVAILDRRSSAVFAAGSILLTKVRASGYHRVKGNFHVSNAALVNFPRVEQSVDGVNFSLANVIPRDLNQADFQYPFDVEIRLPYVRVRYTHGAVDSTFVFAFVELVPTYGVGDDSTGSPDGKISFVRSDKDVDFTGAIAQNDHATADIAALPTNVGVIESISFTAEENLDWEIHFWTASSFDDANLDADSWIEYVAFAIADGVSIANAIPGTFRYAATGLSIPYRDTDGTNTLHVSLVPRSAAKTAGAAGEVVLDVGFRGQA